MQRTQKINDRILRHFREDLELVVIELDADQWRQLSVPPRYRFGWMPPVRVSGDVATVAFSGEMLDRVTAELTDDELEAYLTVIEVVADAYVAQPTMAPDRIDRLVEDTLIAAAPASFSLWQEIDARAIDSGIVG
jgi:hypothetical protein